MITFLRWTQLLLILALSLAAYTMACVDGEPLGPQHCAEVVLDSAVWGPEPDTIVVGHVCNTAPITTEVPR